MAFSYSLKITKGIICIGLVLLGMAACKKGKTPNPPSNGQDTTTTPPVKKTGTDIYAVGALYNQGVPIATYWKNGAAHRLVADPGENSSANGIAILDTDVYICGTDNGAAVYWKNGVQHTLPEGTTAVGITVNGADVYITGTIIVGQNNQAVYWKNGTLVVIGDQTGVNTTYAGGIAVSGSDVYVVGTTYVPNGDPQSNLTWWKNGAPTVIGQTLSFPQVLSIAVNGVDVYSTGAPYNALNFHAQAYYWKNGTPDSLTNVPVGENAGANALTVNNSSIYIVGYTHTTLAAYWKDKTEHDLTEQYTATSITFNGSDMYIGGYGLIGNQIAVYWKNGTMVTLSDSQAIVNGVGVVQF